MPELTLKPDGTLEALVYSRATFEHTCECGCKYTISIDMPEGIIFESSLHIKGATCPQCGQECVLPRGRYTVRNYKLVFLGESKPELDKDLVSSTDPLAITSPKIRT